MIMNQKVDILGVRFDAVGMKSLLELIKNSVSVGKREILAFSNPEFVLEARRNSVLKNYLNNIVTVNLADGMGIVLAARVLGEYLPERVTGTDFVSELFDLAGREKYKIFLLGGKPNVANQVRLFFLNKIGIDCVVGVADGYGDMRVNSEVLEKINSVAPDILMVCLGNPRQEKWILDNIDHLNAKIVFGNGGALDFWSGNVKRAPLWMQNNCLEWLFRFFQDPSFSRFKRQVKLIKFVFLCLFFLFFDRKG